MSDVIKFIAFAIALLIAVIAFSFGICAGCAYLVDRPSCLAKGERMGIPSEWGLWEDCMVQAHGRWVPLKSVREESGELKVTQ